MSFSSNIKDELYQIIGNSRHCQMAELVAVLHYLCREDEQGNFYIYTDHEELLQKCYKLLLRIFAPRKEGEEKPSFEQLCSADVLRTLKLVDDHNRLRSMEEAVDKTLLKQSCCKRAFLRGVFLCSGSVSNPEKGYHLEFVLSGEEFPKQIQSLIGSFGIEAKITTRKKYTIVYIKEGEGIVNLLNVMGAFTSLMDLENLRILKEINNSINRQMNCDTANINKSVAAGRKQIEDIMRIRDCRGFKDLPPSLQEIAELRLSYPELSLKELGEMLDPPIGKSGVNHRLRKLSEIAESLPDVKK